MNESCDVCGRTVDFNPAARTFSHTTTTRCRGIDGIILSQPHPDRDCAENRRTVTGGAPPEILGRVLPHRRTTKSVSLHTEILAWLDGPEA